MSLEVMIIVGLALLFAGWKFWGILRGKSDCGCGSSGSCPSSSANSGCGGCSSQQDSNPTKKQ